MKVYVENGDIPKRCIECRFCYYSEDEYHHCCRINGIDIENKKCWRETHPDCPLLSIFDYTKQVRKELIDKLAIVLIATFSKDAEFSVEEILNWLQEVKDQIQGE